MRPLQKYSYKLLAIGLGVALLCGESAYAAGKPPKPPATPIDPAIVYAINGSLAIANADGSNQKTILSNVGVYASPSWSPSGTKIIFVSDAQNLSGRGIYQISIDRASGQAVGSPQKIASLKSDFLGMANPVWSPVPIPDAFGTNRYFVAYSDTSPGGNDYSIHLVDPATPGSEFKLSTPVVSTSEVGDLEATWSPDATRLAVTRGSENILIPPYDIQIVTLQASGCPSTEPVCEVQARLSLVRDVDSPSELRAASSLHHPRWSKNGENIALSAADVWVIPVADPEDATNLTNTSRHETSPTWSPNDSQIAYRAWGNLCNSKDRNFIGIVVRNVDGTPFSGGCAEKVLIRDGSAPSWWRNHVPLQP